MNDSARKEEWLRYLNVCVLRANGLFAVLESDGEPMVQSVLKDLKISTPMELLKWLKAGER